MLLCLLSGCENGNTDDSRAGGKNVANYADYYPYNTFTDCDENYIYFSTYKGILDTDSVDTGIYRIPRQGDQAELIYKNDASKSVDDVVLREGDVASVHNEWYELSKDNKLTDDGRDYTKELFFFAPQIMAMVATPSGLELYVRWNSLEGIHYSIWREIDSQWIQIQDDYQYLQAY